MAFLMCAPQYAANKGFAEDLTEGKFSFPVVHGILKDKGNRQMLGKYSFSSGVMCEIF
jgi:hypothetical protein